MPSRVLPSELIERIFKRLVALYGASFTRQWKDVPADTMKFTWARELAGFTDAEIVRGLEACRAREFPPTVPEFRNLCRPPMDMEAAFHEAARVWPSREGWSSAVVYWAAQAIGDDVKKQPWNTMRGRWREAYDRALRENQPLPDPAPSPMLSGPPADPAEVDRAYRQVLDKLPDNLKPRRAE